MPRPGFANSSFKRKAPHDRYKLIHYKFDDVDEWEFFDRERDPSEMKSEYGNPEYVRIIAQLKSELARLRDHYGVE